MRVCSRVTGSRRDMAVDPTGKRGSFITAPENADPIGRYDERLPPSHRLIGSMRAFVRAYGRRHALRIIDQE